VPHAPAWTPLPHATSTRTQASAAPSQAPTATKGQATAAKIAISDFAPLAYFSSNCARCHGAYGSFYGAEFGRNLTEAKLRQVVHDMAAGPGNAPLDEAQLDVQIAYHRSLIDKKPFIVVTGATPEQDGSTTLRGETSPDSAVTLRWEGGAAPAKVEGDAWRATLPARVDIGKVKLVAVKGDVHTTLDPEESAYSHRTPLAAENGAGNSPAAP
jgi:hypothetical protein